MERLIGAILNSDRTHLLATCVSCVILKFSSDVSLYAVPSHDTSVLHVSVSGLLVSCRISVQDDESIG